MGLVRCPEDECQRVLDVPEIPWSWRCPDGRCASCNDIAPEELAKMQIPEQIVRQLVKPSNMQMSSSVPPPAQPTPIKYKMETGVPPPTRMAHLKPTSLYPFDKMHAPKPDGSAASFYIECADSEARKKLSQRLSAAAYSYSALQKKNGKKPCKFTVRNVDSGVRVWRIK